MLDAAEVNLDSPESLADPTGYFAAAREHGDVQWSAHHRAWLVLSHAGVEAGFRDTSALSSDKTGSFQRAAQGRSEAFQRVAELLSGWMNFRDPPAHTRLREPVRSAFTPRAISGLAREVQAIVDGALDALDTSGADLSHDFARPIPALVIGALLGVSPQDRHRFYNWSHDLGQLVFSLNPSGSPEGPVSAAASEFIAFFGDLIERERATPTGSPLSGLVAAAGDLNPIELIGACTLLLFGGHETTTTLLVNALGILLTQPETAAWLRAHPGAMDTAVEEFMRVQGPARSLPRKVTVDHERGGQQLHRGQNAYLCIAAANHDPAVFTDPAGLELERAPNPHLGFGWGLHYCLGASLARLEAGIALRTLLERFPNMQALGEVPPPRASAMGYGRRPLRVRLA
ncbi:MAG: cytochrome P450 [Chloroflexi bacterium]|nr:cytochrome P450 [Chloroflexota bacterium]